jgi:SAM-dependent methyltransferase
MLPDGVGNYLGEIRRVLKPGGRCLITWFLLNAESGALIRESASSLEFTHPIGDCLTTNPETPEEAICYRLEHVIALYQRVGLQLEPPIRYGSWCGRKDYLSYQDICIGRKPAPG